MTQPTRESCPVCGVPVSRPTGPSASRSDFPFCSERCRMVDLGRWLTGGYAIPGEPVEQVPPPPDPDA